MLFHELQVEKLVCNQVSPPGSFPGYVLFLTKFAPSVFVFKPFSVYNWVGWDNAGSSGRNEEVHRSFISPSADRRTINVLLAWVIRQYTFKLAAVEFGCECARVWGV